MMGDEASNEINLNKSRLLYPPANNERIPPEDIPRDGDVFLAWVSCACVEFPIQLMKEGRWAADELIGYRADPGSFEKFVANYHSWWVLPENEKLALMTSGQRESRRRDRYRRAAREIAIERKTEYELPTL